MLWFERGAVVPISRDAKPKMQSWWVPFRSHQKPFLIIIPNIPGLAVLGDRVFAVGGFNGSLRVRTVDVYDPNTDSWSTSSNMQARRSTLGVAVVNNILYAVGGNFSAIYPWYLLKILDLLPGFDGTTGLSSAEMFDLKTQEWKLIVSFFLLFCFYSFLNSDSS